MTAHRLPGVFRSSFQSVPPLLAARSGWAAGGGGRFSEISPLSPGTKQIGFCSDQEAPPPRRPPGPQPETKPPWPRPPLRRPPAGVSPPSTTLTPKMDPPGEARALSRAFSNVARALGPSVVRVDVEVAHPDGDDDGGGAPDPSRLPPQLRRFFQFGEPADPDHNAGPDRAWCLDGAGNIVTNRHVVSHATKVSVTLSDGRELSAKVVGADSQTDVAVVRLEKPPAGLVAARLGDSDKLDVGEWVLAVGSPLGLDQTVTAGIVSGKGRVGRHVQMSGERVRHYIQTDAKINPGNSGGPLVNLGAEVVGINTLINTGPGGAYGFAIPINQVRRVAEALIKDGRVRYPYLGVLVGDIKDLDPDKRATLGRSGAVPARGAFVSDLTPASPAARAGLRAGDVITQIDAEPIDGAGDVIDYVSSRSIGTKVQVGYVRDGKKAAVAVVLAELPDRGSGASEETGARYGLSLQTLTPRLAESLGLATQSKGAVIVEVAPDSPADKAGLTVGDLIVEIDRKAIATVDEATAALRAARKGGHLLRVRGAGTALDSSRSPTRGRKKKAVNRRRIRDRTVAFRRFPEGRRGFSRSSGRGSGHLR